MSCRRPHRVFLTGFSGSGKSAVAPLVAAALGWRALDADDLIERASGRSIADVFARDGEGAFRELERQAIAEAAAQDSVVVAVGGGGVLSAENRRRMAEGGFLVCLEARPETLWQRLEAGGGPVSERPLLAGPDPLGRIRALKAIRQPLYVLADCTVHTDHLTPSQVAEEVVRAWRELSGVIDRAKEPSEAPAGDDFWVRAESAAYPVRVGWGALETLPQMLRDAGLSGRAHVINDESVWSAHGERILSLLREGGFAADSHVVAPGDASKSLVSATSLYSELARERAERRDTVIAFGGGMVGDLAGFVAATYLRGLALVQAPTSLLAMADASIGGKVAVNLAEAKNLVGVFYQPRFVLADTSLLATLPKRELTSGWGEVIKHALIADEALLELLETRHRELLALEPEAITELVRRNVAIKARVVSEDEREATGRRMILNYGHTVAHAIEAVTGYGDVLHGEADAIGMMVAAEIGAAIGVTPPDLIERQRRLFETYGLPTKRKGLDRDRLRAAMALDKKVSRGAVRWVLLQGVGSPIIRDDVPADVVDAAIARYTG